MTTSLRKSEYSWEPVEEDEELKEISQEEYIIIDDTDSDPDDGDDDYVDEAGADIMVRPINFSSRPPNQ